MKIVSTLLIAVLLSGPTTAQDVPIPDFIKADIDDFDGAEMYQHKRLNADIAQSWINKETEVSIRVALVPAIVKDPGSTYQIAVIILGTLQGGLKDATGLSSFQIKPSGGKIYTIEFESSFMSGKARGGLAEYKVELRLGEGNLLTVYFLDSEGISLMKMLGESGEIRTVVRLKTNKGNLTMDVPLSVSESVSEFYEWAQEFYKEKGLTWPGVEE